MNKIIRVADKERGIVQITTVDERWYAKPDFEPGTKLPVYTYVPSVTWICNYYPKGIGYMKWLAEHGWDDAEAIKNAAGNKGSKVHQAIAFLLDGFEVKMEHAFTNEDGNPEALTLEEYEAILSFAAWFDLTKPKVLAREIVVWSEDFSYAGTVDFVCEIAGVKWVVDFKTSQFVWPSHEIQISAYKNADDGWPDAKLAILQIGYKKNKAGWKWNEVEDQFPLFLAARQIWAKETAGQKPKQRDYPVSVKLQKPDAEAVAVPLGVPVAAAS